MAAQKALDDVVLRYAIDDLAARFSEALSQQDRDGFLDVWTCGDPEWGLPGMSPALGLPAVAAQFDFLFRKYQQIFQTPTSGVMSLHGDRVVGRRHIDELATDAAGRTTRFVGLYEDEIVSRDNGWVFQRRTFRIRYRIWLSDGVKWLAPTEAQEAPERSPGVAAPQP